MFDADSGTSTATGSSSASSRSTLAAPPTRSTARDASINRQIWNQAKAVPGTNNGGKYSTEAITAAIAARTDPTRAPRRTSPTCSPVRLGEREARGLVQGRRPVPVRWVRQPWVLRLRRLGCAELADVPLLQRLRALQTGRDLVDHRLRADFPPTADGANGTILVLNNNGTVVPTDLGPLLSINGDAAVNGVPFDEHRCRGRPRRHERQRGHEQLRHAQLQRGHVRLPRQAARRLRRHSDPKFNYSVDVN